MGGYLFVFAHPYFAVTDQHGNFEIKDAPAGKYRLIVWHERTGWLLGDQRPSKDGKLITIAPNKATDLGKIGSFPVADRDEEIRADKDVQLGEVDRLGLVVVSGRAENDKKCRAVAFELWPLVGADGIFDRKLMQPKFGGDELELFRGRA